MADIHVQITFKHNIQHTFHKKILSILFSNRGLQQCIHIYMCMLPFERKDLKPRMTKLDLLISLFVSDFSSYFRHHYRWRIANFDLYSALMAIGQTGFFSVSTYCDAEHSSPGTRDTHLFAERSPVLTTYVCRGWDSYT